MTTPSFPTKSLCWALGLVLATISRTGQSSEPRQEKPRLSTSAQIAEVDRAFAQPAVTLGPRLVIFPVADGARKLRPDGALLGHMATLAAHYTPHKRLAMSTHWHQEVLGGAGCLFPENELDARTIELCQAVAQTKLYVLPLLKPAEPASKGFSLEIEFHGDGGQPPDKVFQHAIGPGELRTIPGLIASDVLGHLGIALSKTELADVLAPQLQSDADLGTLNEAFQATKQSRSNDERLVALLQDNPRCVVAWEKYLKNTNRWDEALAKFRGLKPPLECDGLEVVVGMRTRDFLRPETALMHLLPLAPTHRDDSFYQVTLMRCGMALGNEQLTQHLLRLWKTCEPGYSGCYYRGSTLVDWAWQARGDGWAFTVTPSGWKAFDVRLQAAQQELEQALRIVPEGWSAHGRLITVAMGRSLPRNYMEQHFKQAVQIRPKYQPAYAAKFTYLLPRWHGTKEELLAFGETCAATGYWDAGIPQMVGWVVGDYSLDWENAAMRYSGFQDDHLWKVLTAYYRSAMEHGNAEDRRQAINAYAQWGVSGGYFEDVVIPFQLLRDWDRRDESIIGGSDNYQFLYRLVHAQTGRLPMSGLYPNDRNLCRSIVALSLGESLAAEKYMAQVEGRGKHGNVSWRSIEKAIELGKRLQSERRLTLAPLDVTECFDGAAGIWSLGSGAVVCSLVHGGGGEIVCPIGIRHGVISGTLEHSGEVTQMTVRAHTRALRDEVLLDYRPQESIVQLVRNRGWVHRDPMSSGPQEFRIEYRAGKDLFQPYPGKRHEMLVHDDVPSGFAFGVLANGPGKVSVRDLTIELRD